MSSKQSAFLVRDGEVSGVDPGLVLVEVADRQHEVLRTDELSGWFGIGSDGVARRLHAPTRQHQHQRPVLRRIRSAIVGQRSVLAVYGRTP